MFFFFSMFLKNMSYVPMSYVLWIFSSTSPKLVFFLSPLFCANGDGAFYTFSRHQALEYLIHLYSSHTSTDMVRAYPIGSALVAMARMGSFAQEHMSDHVPVSLNGPKPPPNQPVIPPRTTSHLLDIFASHGPQVKDSIEGYDAEPREAFVIHGGGSNSLFRLSLPFIQQNGVTD